MKLESRFYRGVIPPLAVLLPALFLSGCHHAEEEVNPKPLVAVKVATAEVTDLQRTVHAPATVFPREQANIAGRISAPIRELKAKKGDTVSAGQVVASLQNADIQAQMLEAQGAVVDAQNSLQKTTSGTLPSDTERGRGQVATTKAALNQAQQIYEKRKKLYEQGAIPQRDLLISETDLANARTNYEVAVKSLDLLQNQSNTRDVKIAESRLKQAEARLDLVKAQLQYAELKAPFAGTLTEQFMYPGDMARPDAPVFTIMDLAVVIARAQIPESEAGAIRVGESCNFHSADAPDFASHGQISVVSRTVDPQRRTVEAWCQIPQQARALRSGVFGTLEVVTGKEPKSIMIPQAAVQFTEGTKKGFVFVVDDKKTAHKKEIETGGLFDGKVQVKSGLNAGEVVIVEGGYGIPEGAAVQLAGEPAK